MIRLIESGTSERGTVLLETLISHTLAFVALAATAAMLALSTRTLLHVRRAAEGAYAAVRVRNLLQRVADDGDFGRIVPLFRLHPHGAAEFTDGTPNRFGATRPALQPDGESDAVTSARLNMAETQLVVALDGDAARVTVCPRWGGALSRDGPGSFLGISADGVAELTGRPVAHGGREECSDITLHAGKSMLAADAHFDVRFVRMLVPFTALYTLYVDRDHELRIVTHRGEQNTENQPVLRGMESLRIESEGLFPRALRAELKLPDQPPWRLQAGAHFAPIPSYSFLLNRP